MTSWRIINEGRFSEPMHHALDKALTDSLKEGKMKPTLRFWYRKNASVPMGRFQAYNDEVEHDYIQDQGIEVVRRNTGGGAMFAEPGNVITYSLHIPRDQVSGNVEESYQQLDSWAVEALNELGINVNYQPLNDIEHEDGKVGGAAQLRRGDSVLHHTMISYDLNIERMLKALRIGKEKVSDKAIKSAEKRVTRISDHVDHDREEVVEKLIEKFREEYGGKEASLTQDEIERAEKLAEEKFSKEEWNKKL